MIEEIEKLITKYTKRAQKDTDFENILWDFADEVAVLALDTVRAEIKARYIWDKVKESKEDK